jgi:SAM-dependent methyltransferase
MAEYLSGSGRLLDVGTAQGDFLALMRDRGWDVEGIEPFGSANPHGLRIHHVHFPNDAVPGEFDVITAWAVFEHLHDPAAAFKACAKMLSPDGRLIVQVPNARSIFFHARQEDVPRHLYFFTPKTLERYADESGLDLIRVHHTTDLFGGTGRGILRLWLVRLWGRSQDEFFEVWRTPRRERFKRWPLLAFAWTAIAMLERAILTNWLVRTLRVSGQIVVELKLSKDSPGRAYISSPSHS